MKSKIYSMAAAILVISSVNLIPAVISKGADEGKITLLLIDPNEKPLPFAKIYQYYALHYDQQHGTEYVCDANGKIELPEANLFPVRQPVSLYASCQDKYAGFIDLNPTDVDKEIEMQLSPARKLTGTIKSTELLSMGQSLDAWVYVFLGKDRLLSFAGTKSDFQFLLPPAEYTVKVAGTKTYDYYENISIAPDQNLNITLDVPANRLAKLIGKPAPEFNQLKGWLNTKPINLSDLRGKIVLLDFFRTCCQNGAGPMPKLVELQQKYKDKDFVIVAIHADKLDSTKDLEEKLRRFKYDYWKNLEITFPIALDGGGLCQIEGTKLFAQGATNAQYGIMNYPVMVLIDKQGKVLNNFNICCDLEYLDKLLNQ